MASNMADEPPAQGKRLLAGFYDPEKRKKDVMERLEKELKIFMELDFTQDIAPQLERLNANSGAIRGIP